MLRECDYSQALLEQERLGALRIARWAELPERSRAWASGPHSISLRRKGCSICIPQKEGVLQNSVCSTPDFLSKNLQPLLSWCWTKTAGTHRY